MAATRPHFARHGTRPYLEAASKSCDQLSVLSLTRIIAIAAAIAFALPGVWAMVAPRSFFESLARFEPYNQHFVQDIGAFQLGLAAVLLLPAIAAGVSGVTTALLGAGLGSALHVASHVVGRELGGAPERDTPQFTALTLVLLVTGLLRWRGERRGPVR